MPAPKRRGQKKNAISKSTYYRRLAEDVRKTIDLPVEQYDSQVVVKDDEEATRLLRTAGIDHAGVVASLLTLIPFTCKELHLIPNRFLYLNGILATMAKFSEANGQPTVESPLASEEDFEAARENLFLRVELDRIFGDYAYHLGYYAGRQQVDWLEDQFKCKYDLEFCSQEVFDIRLDDTGREICQFFGDRSAAQNLPRNYTEADLAAMYKGFAGPLRERQRLLQVFRGSGKTAITSCHTARSIVMSPDSRFLIVTATKPLAREMLDLTRNKFVILDYSRPDRFQSLFPHHCIPAGTDSTNFDSPLRRLNLRGKNIMTSSSDSDSAGMRCDELILDDFMGTSIGTSKNQITHASLLAKYDLLLSLGMPHSQQLVVGTPYQPSLDIYSTIKQRNAARKGNLISLERPVWVVKEEFKRAQPPDLEPHMVIMASDRIEFEDMKTLAVDNYVNFSRQYLVQAIANEDDMPLFDEPMWEASLVHPHDVHTFNVEHFGIVDPAGSANDRSDDSCLLRVSRARDMQGVLHIYIHNFLLRKEKYGDLSKTLVDFYRDDFLAGQLRAVAIEKPHQHELWEAAIKEACRIRLPQGVLPLKWIPTDNLKGAKLARIRNASILMQGPPIQLHFVRGPWNQAAKEYLLRYSGKKSSTSAGTKDDFADAVALACDWLIESTQKPAEVKSTEPPRRPTEQEQKDDASRQVAAMQASWEASMATRDSAAQQAMSGLPGQVSMTHSEWQAKQRGGSQPTDSFAPKGSAMAKRLEKYLGKDLVRKS